MTNGKYDVLDSSTKSEIQGGDSIIDLPSWSMIECWECGEPYQVTRSDARKKKLKECVCSDCHQYMLGKKDSSDRIAELEESARRSAEHYANILRGASVLMEERTREIAELEAQLKTAKRDGILEAAIFCVRDDSFFGIDSMEGCTYSDLLEYANSLTGEE